MNRRDAVFALIALGATVKPLVTRAQNPANVPRVGTFMFGSVATSGVLVDAFVRGLRENGFSEGTNIGVERRWAEGDVNKLPIIAADLVRQKVDVVFAGSAPAVMELKKLSSTIPIVVATGFDPVVAGLAESLARPGGNVTGMSINYIELSAKRLQLLKETYPKVSRLAVFYSLGPENRARLEHVQHAAKVLGLQTFLIEVRNNEDLAPGFEAAKKWRADAVFLMEGNQIFFARQLLAEYAVQNRLPAIYGTSAYAEAGGLMSYGGDYVDLSRRGATYVAKILKGAKPSDLPIEQPTSYEMVINLRAAKAIDLKIPQSVLLRADRVIE